MVIEIYFNIFNVEPGLSNLMWTEFTSYDKNLDDMNSHGHLNFK